MRLKASPGAHVAVLGMQGAITRAPWAAALAAATCGFAMLLHIPNGLMFTRDRPSRILAGHGWVGFIGFSGMVTKSWLGPLPIEHISVEPLQTGMEISPGYVRVRVCASASLTFSGVKGTERSRAPVASYTALAIAAGMAQAIGSPAPHEGVPGRSISATSTLGASVMVMMG